MPAPARRHGVVAIHGVGVRRARGSFLAGIMNSVASFLEQAGGSVEREFDSAARPAHGSLVVTPPGGAAAEEIVATEVFWDDIAPGTQPRVVFRRLLAIGPRQIRDIARGLWRDPANDHPSPEDEPVLGDGGYLAGPAVRWMYRAELTLLIGALFAAWAVSLMVWPLLWLLYTMADTPGLRAYGLTKTLASGIHSLDPLMGAALSDAQRVIEDGMRSADVQRVAHDAIAAYVRDPGIADVTIVAHSEGAVVAYDALREGGPLAAAFAALAEPKRLTLVTLGSGVNRNYGWSEALPRSSFGGRLPRQPFDARITGHGTAAAASPEDETRLLRGHFYWLDIYARMDPVPAGGLREKVREAARVDARQLKRRQVINSDNPLSDHTTYFGNRELVTPRLVRAIYGGEYPWSRPAGSSAGPTAEVTPEGVRRRIRRVAWLQLMRLALAGSTIANAAALWLSDAWRGFATGWLEPVLEEAPALKSLYDDGRGDFGEALPSVLIAIAGALVVLGILRSLRDWFFAEE